MGQIVYTGGTFDLLHSGHVRFLQACRKIAGHDGTVVVSLNTDEFISAYKGKPPVMSFEERKEVLQALRCVDRVVANVGGADSKPAILDVMPDFLLRFSLWDLRRLCLVGIAINHCRFLLTLRFKFATLCP